MMRAAVLMKPGVVRIADDWPEPVCGPRDVIVAVTGTGICGTDLAYVHGDRDIVDGGLIVGHEPFGTIVAVGEQIDAARIGERVAIEPNYPCGDCAPCVSGEPSLCTARRSPVVTEHGFLAERVAVPAAFAWPLPATLSDRDAACIEPLAVAYAAVRRAGTIAAGARIGIVGAGSIGRILADLLVRAGHVPALTDIDDERVARAVAAGARAATPDDAYDLVFETSGNGAAASAAALRLAAQGQMVLVGVSPQTLQIPLIHLVRRGITVRGSMIYDHPIDYPQVIRLIADGRATPGAVLGEPFALADTEVALRGAASRAEKTWIRVADGGDHD